MYYLEYGGHHTRSRRRNPCAKNKEGQRKATYSSALLALGVPAKTRRRIQVEPQSRRKNALVTPTGTIMGNAIRQGNVGRSGPKKVGDQQTGDIINEPIR